MTEEEIRTVLSAETPTDEDLLDALAAICGLANDADTQATARELVIRTLAIKERLRPDFLPLLDGLVRSVGLLPYADGMGDGSLDDRFLVEAHRAPLPGEDLVFHTLQLQIYQDIVSGRNVVLSATTSVGKSLIVDAVIASGRFRNIAIIVPTIALIDETRRRLASRFAGTHEVITHPTQRPDFTRPVIFVLTQERALVRDDMGGVEFFVIDEFYKLEIDEAEPERPVDLNLVFARLAAQKAQFYLIGPNVGAVLGIAGAYNPVFIPSEFATVALDVVQFNLPEQGLARKEKLVELCRGLRSPTLVYCQSPPRAADLAEHLLAHGDLRLSPSTAAAVDWLRREYPEEWILTRALEHGVGIHHGNVPRAIQQYMIRAFDAGEIGMIICTSTLIEGINTVAENVIVYDRRIENSLYDGFTFRNIAGRAGRMRRYFIGKVFVLQAAPADEPMSVSVAVGTQDEDTPMSLLLGLAEDELTPVSRARVDDMVAKSPLSFETLRLNRHVPLDMQFAVHAQIVRDLVLLEDALLWTGMPEPFQLLKICELIHDHLDGAALTRYGIMSGLGLKAELDRLRMAQSFGSFIRHRVTRKASFQTVSDAVEQSLRFMRRYVAYTFPRSLGTIGNIQAEVFRRHGRDKVGDYGTFGSRAASLFMSPGLFALDEYGVPLETARRVGAMGGNAATLDQALDLLARSAANAAFDLHPFEREVVNDLLATLPQARRELR